MDKQDIITEKIIEEPLGDDDIRAYLPQAKIYKYSVLSKYNTLDDLLPGEVDYVILLYEDKPNKGHWVCVNKYDNIYEYFDSYGEIFDKPLQWNPAIENLQLNQKPYLTNLFNKTNKKVIYNPIKYQDTEDDINTCGRHCIFRILNLLEKKRDLKKYYELMKEIKKLTKYPYDDIVANFINIFN